MQLKKKRIYLFFYRNYRCDVTLIKKLGAGKCTIEGDVVVFEDNGSGILRILKGNRRRARTNGRQGHTAHHTDLLAKLLGKILSFMLRGVLERDRTESGYLRTIIAILR